MISRLIKFVRNFKKDRQGNLLLFALVFGTISFTIVITGISGYAIYENKASIYKHNREQAFQIAEAGINYYRWHLAHNKTDYYDGQGATSTGPYVHDYYDKDGNLIGYYSLNIVAPLSGSTVVTVSSTGWIKDQVNSKRTIQARLGFVSLTDYAFLSNTDVWIGDNEIIHGKFHANGGIRFDGTGDAPITSAKETYYCQAVHGSGCNNTLKPGIWGDGEPQTYWDFPVPAFDFDVVTSKLADIKDGAEESGIYLTSSGLQGWRLRFDANGKVYARKVYSTTCYNGKSVEDKHFNSYCVDIDSYDENPETEYNIPANGYIYVEDTVWVDGTVKGRATIGTSVGKSIIINGNILYDSKDGTNVLGLIAKQDILIPKESPNELEINAAVLAQNGSAQRYYYSGDMKDEITTYGSVITNGIWTWSWVTGGGSVVSGYRYTNSTYDANLTYNPPPGFPVGNEYNLLSWEEVEY
ncbi:MAG: hypothetical protein COU31_05140 [Candidatus Magasanikbacteria bacterium CG10_big_fil_rev_8_21_14_0_10_40_10]|uniref:Type 4 fimbrial biogenesis protein PilX N-terminal domain-containing protein n=1 Tax=Candidatus Magasanikbacteria bacterium CG10_big_fil_rev_8_21_14_0_10_40_10 TaxID=1974648 RepID=A0A2M6W2M8_9BACT|nr:MAG: hypothetical protein COU31_05140 [Candidatus Magasanikbacteria bacterium CG10_big_fil_rev_8_21_14_0_10_40_10]